MSEKAALICKMFNLDSVEYIIDLMAVMVAFISPDGQQLATETGVTLELAWEAAIKKLPEEMRLIAELPTAVPVPVVEDEPCLIPA